MNLESFAATQRQDGRKTNEDAFLIRTGRPAFLALADGAGAAEQAARRVLRQFDGLTREPGDPLRFTTWSGWLRALDSALLGGAESTLVSVALYEDRLVGAVVGDSRAYLWSREGDLQLLTEVPSKARLGSGRIEACPLHAPLRAGDVVLLLSDGAWTPLSFDGLRRVVARAALRPTAELPEAVLTEAARHGRADDMTVVAARWK